MTQQIRCGEDLGITGCTFVARGEAPGPIVERVVDHLRDQHAIQLPSAETIMTGNEPDSRLGEDARLIVERLRAKLGLSAPLNSEWQPGIIKRPPGGAQ